jgi:hypothetical protein
MKDYWYPIVSFPNSQFLYGLVGKKLCVKDGSF